MAEPGKINPMDLMRMAKQLKTNQGAQNEAAQLEQLAQNGLDEAQQAKLHDLMRDKAKLAQLMQSPQAQELMRKLGGKQAD